MRVSELRRSQTVDAGIALAYLGCSLLLARQDTGEGYAPPDAAGYALSAAICLPLALRRRRPVAVTAVVLALWTLYVTLGYFPAANSLAPLLALYTVAATRPLRTAAVAAAALGAVWVYAGVVAPHGSVATAAAMAAVMPAVVVRFGQAARRSERRGERLAELTRQLRAERDDRARRAVADEQARIARELHDVIAHHFAVISVQSGLARYVFDGNPEKARRALAVIEETSGEVLAEMRRMLTLLRGASTAPADGGAAPYDPVPRLDGLSEMVERLRAGGLVVGLAVEGTVRPLPSGVGLCAYRVVQEALTNVLKHAGPARAEVRVRYEPHRLQVSVADDGKGGNPAVVGAGTGHGLIGMRERAKLYGGAVEIGPRPAGGFEVRLTLPTSAAAARGEAGD
ncbi:sensor histidine kinase [Streptomyces polyrhachis]|uniref:histidine kinase n=1 Tax=Streptomyces polyrhachis TaxID=1282885 RepID=A0ABW2G9E7_9ACTN